MPVPKKSPTKTQPTTLIRLRKKIENPVEREDQLASQSRIPGTVVAYIEGEYVISLHEDTHPHSSDNPKAKRVTAFVAKT